MCIHMYTYICIYTYACIHAQYEMEINKKISREGGIPGVADFLGTVDLRPIAKQLPPGIGSQEGMVWTTVQGKTLDQFFDRYVCVCVYMCVCVYIYIYIYIHTHTYALCFWHTHTCPSFLFFPARMVWAAMHRKGFDSTSIFLSHRGAYKYMHTHMYGSMHAHTCVNEYMHTFLHMFMCVLMRSWRISLFRTCALLVHTTNRYTHMWQHTHTNTHAHKSQLSSAGAAHLLHSKLFQITDTHIHVHTHTRIASILSTSATECIHSKHPHLYPYYIHTQNKIHTKKHGIYIFHNIGAVECLQSSQTHWRWRILSRLSSRTAVWCTSRPTCAARWAACNYKNESCIALCDIHVVRILLRAICAAKWVDSCAFLHKLYYYAGVAGMHVRT